MMKLSKPLVLGLALLSAATAFPQQKPINANRIYQLRDLGEWGAKINGHSLRLWIMDTDSKRAEGMMFLTAREVADNEGMIFVFGQERPLSFWMENTILPLDIIYVNAGGRVLNIQKGRPYDRTGLPSSGPAKYVIELKQGKAVKYGIRPGMRIAIPSTLRSKD